MVAGGDAGDGQARGEAARLAIEFAVGDRRTEMLDGDVIGATSGVVLEGVVDEVVRGCDAGAKTEALEQHLVGRRQVDEGAAIYTERHGDLSWVGGDRA